jgi:hypothetical protein
VEKEREGSSLQLLTVLRFGVFPYSKAPKARREFDSVYLLPSLLEDTRDFEASWDSAWSVAPQKRQTTKMHALRSGLIFKKKRCFLVCYILQDILNEIMTALAKTHPQLFPIFSSLLC